jgi:hypothetical protein
MRIRYVEPLRLAWERTKSLLFRNSSLETWFVMGFTVWLARLWDNAGMGGSSWHDGGSLGKSGIRIRNGDWDWFRIDEGAFDGIGALGVLVVLGLVVLGLLVALVLTWLSSRGEFCFLDNVVHRRAALVEPWKRTARLGDSLFLWRIAFQIVAGALALALILPAVLMIVPAVHDGPFQALGVVGAVLLGVLGLILGLGAALISFWTDQFVVPVMYRAEISVLEGWRRVLPLIRANLDHAVLYALFWVLLSVLVVAAVAVAGTLTCCVGWMILAIPYVGTVLLLPVYATGRAFGPEFLAQFGPEWRLWEPDGNAEDPV